MATYIIQRTDGAYVSRPGSEKSYTQKLQHARVFKTREDAERELCPGNESVVCLEDLLEAELS